MPDLSDFSWLHAENIADAISWYEAQISGISLPNNLRGIELFETLKRNAVGEGPYPHTTLFESSNRIMTDLVLLYGVQWLVNSELPFSEFNVDFGHANTQGHDVISVIRSPSLDAEVFNVAPTFFQGKKGKTLKKMRKDSSANYQMIIVNFDAVSECYQPRLRENETILLVDIHNNTTRLLEA
jgi:hypothetical protein